MLALLMQLGGQLGIIPRKNVMWLFTGWLIPCWDRDWRWEMRFDAVVCLHMFSGNLDSCLVVSSGSSRLAGLGLQVSFSSFHLSIHAVQQLSSRSPLSLSLSLLALPQALEAFEGALESKISWAVSPSGKWKSGHGKVVPSVFTSRPVASWIISCTDINA